MMSTFHHPQAIHVRLGESIGPELFLPVPPKISRPTMPTLQPSSSSPMPREPSSVAQEFLTVHRIPLHAPPPSFSKPPRPSDQVPSHWPEHIPTLYGGALASTIPQYKPAPPVYQRTLYTPGPDEPRSPYLPQVDIPSVQQDRMPYTSTYVPEFITSPDTVEHHVPVAEYDDTQWLMDVDSRTMRPTPSRFDTAPSSSPHIPLPSHRQVQCEEYQSRHPNRPYSQQPHYNIPLDQKLRAFTATDGTAVPGDNYYELERRRKLPMQPQLSQQPESYPQDSPSTKHLFYGQNGGMYWVNAEGKQVYLNHAQKMKAQMGQLPNAMIHDRNDPVMGEFYANLSRDHRVLDDWARARQR